MKVRIKFTKEGCMKFIGHLDMMRYFQKAMRRAQIPIAFTGGFSPHMIMSFAAPLGVGLTSMGEYFDMELSCDMPTGEIRDRLNAVMVEGVTVVSAKKVEDGKASKAMSLVAAADYRIRFREGAELKTPWKEQLLEFAALPSITVRKKTKRSEKDVDIRPFIYELYLDGDEVCMKLASASGNYTKPELVMDTFLAYAGVEAEPFAYMVQRQEVYALVGETPAEGFVSLEALGEDVE